MQNHIQINGIWGRRSENHQFIHSLPNEELFRLCLRVLASSPNSLYLFIYGHSINRMSYAMLNRKSMHLLCNIFYSCVQLVLVCNVSKKCELEKRTSIMAIKKPLTSSRHTHRHTNTRTHDIASKQSNSCVMECERVLFVWILFFCCCCCCCFFCADCK